MGSQEPFKREQNMWTWRSQKDKENKTRGEGTWPPQVEGTGVGWCPETRAPGSRWGQEREAEGRGCGVLEACWVSTHNKQWEGALWGAGSEAWHANVSGLGRFILAKWFVGLGGRRSPPSAMRPDHLFCFLHKYVSLHVERERFENKTKRHFYGVRETLIYY